MNLQRIAIPLLVIGLLVFAGRQYGWAGVAAVGGGLVMWLLLHWTRMMTVMKRAADRPIGWVASAVMLNARLQPGVNLMHVVAMTQSLGEQLSQPNADPEVYRWKDGTESTVTCEFRHGKLVKWELVRPTPAPEEAQGAGSPPAAP